MGSQNETSKKAGPVDIEFDSLRGGEVLGVVELKTVLVKLRDGNGKEQVKIAFLFPGGEARFLDEKSIGAPAQNWVKKGIASKLPTED